MKMLRYYLPFLLALFMLPALNTRAADATSVPYEPLSKEAIAHMTKEEKEARLVAIKARVEEIKAMDKSALTKDERRALRKELKSMHREARYVTGVYISVGALIIIILLLIIII
ncbi:MAG TPA: hypothetical protein VHD83_10820 [Puia sp.]|nr:hypothetical protein [Puia sp.]